MNPCLDNPWKDPDQFERVRPLGPDFDDIPEEVPVFRFTLVTGQTFEVAGDDNRLLTIENLEDNGVAFIVEATGELAFPEIF